LDSLLHFDASLGSHDSWFLFLFSIVSFFALKHDSGLLRISAWEAGVFVWQAYSEIE